MKVGRITPLIVASLLATACSGAGDPLTPSRSLAPGESWFSTDAAQYEIRVVGAVHAVDFELAYRNPLDQAVAVPACHNPVRPLLEKQVDGGWILAHAPIELMCITAPLVIPAGATHTFRYPLRADGYDLDSWRSRTGGTLDGTYRLRWFVGTHAPRSDNGIGVPLAEEYSVSNSFVLELKGE
jgi:hypothetical protein